MEIIKTKNKFTFDEVIASGIVLKNKHKLIYIKKDRTITVYKLIKNYYVKYYSYLA